MNDRLQKFLFQHAAVRGEFVELSKSWSQMQSHHHYPLPVTRLLGEMIGAAILLSGNIKFNGSLVMQIQGNGPVRLLVVECDSAMKIRATAKLDETAVIHGNETFTDLINAHGKGRFVITLDPHEKNPGQRPYQGIVSLEGDSIAQVIENYMKQSEQLDTHIWKRNGDTNRWKYCKMQWEEASSLQRLKSSGNCWKCPLWRTRKILAGSTA